MKYHYNEKFADRQGSFTQSFSLGSVLRNEPFYLSQTYCMILSTFYNET